MINPFRRKDTSKIVEGAVSGIDRLFLSKEEKVDSMMKIADAQAEWVKSTLNSDTVSSKARRYIAVAVIFVFLAMLITSIAFYRTDKEYSMFIFDMAKSDISILVIMIAGFYFGGYMASTHILSGVSKRKNKE